MPKDQDKTIAIKIMFDHYIHSKPSRTVYSFNPLHNGYEVVFHNIEDCALISTWGDRHFIEEVGDVLNEHEIDIYDWSFRCRTDNSSSKTTKIIRVEFHDIKP